MKNKDLIFLLFFVVIIIVSTIILSINQSNKEKKIGIDFEVHKIETTPALRLVLYDKMGEKLDFQHFVFYNSHHVKVGDIIFKDENSDTLKVYTLDSVGKRRIKFIMKMK